MTAHLADSLAAFLAELPRLRSNHAVSGALVQSLNAISPLNLLSAS